MRSTLFRTLARVFAVLLLAWTTADLCCGWCVHDREPIAAGVAEGPAGARTIMPPSAAPSPELPGGPDDCFCCSHFVHPQVRYQVVPVYSLVTTVEAERAAGPEFPALELYHPPLGTA